MSELEQVTSGLVFPEGPVAMADGSVVLVEMLGQRITRVAPDGTKDTVAESAADPTGSRSVPTAPATCATTAGLRLPVRGR